MKVFYIYCFCLVFVESSSAQKCEDGQVNCVLESSKEPSPNVSQKIGGLLEICSLDGPLTGFLRDGYCHYSISDRGKHLVLCGSERYFS